MKCIGLITGPDTPEALFYLEELHREMRRRRGPGASAYVVAHHLDVSRLGGLDSASEAKSAKAHILAAARNLKAAGAHLLLLGSSTLHVVASEVAAEADLPLCHVGHLTAKTLAKMGLGSTGVVGTRTASEERMWTRCLIAAGVEPIFPSATDRVWIRSCLAEEMDPEVCRAEWVRITTDLRQAGANTVVLCTPEANAYLRAEDLLLPLVCAAGQQVKAAVDAVSAY
ncbi:MAG: aspartate/glutamate racemase family protein [Opitutaceae bacterium]|nr:aspartate/glutamate racemase family protein [Opitutaceae bacterium]